MSQATYYPKPRAWKLANYFAIPPQLWDNVGIFSYKDVIIFHVGQCNVKPPMTSSVESSKSVTHAIVWKSWNQDRTPYKYYIECQVNVST